MYFLHLFHAGGFMMYPLLLCSIIVVAIFFERYRYYSSHRSDTERLSAVMTDSLNRGDIEGLKNALKADGGIPAVCTATGLFVAIIALIAYTYLSQQVSHYISSIEKLSSVYLAIAEGKEK